MVVVVAAYLTNDDDVDVDDDDDEFRLATLLVTSLNAQLNFILARLLWND